MNETIIAFAICLLNKIDASRFSGPEQFFAGAPYISLRKEIERRFFDADPTDADASIDRVACCLAPLYLHASRQTLCDTVRALESRPLSVNLCTVPRITVSSSRSSTLSMPSHSYPRIIACSRLSPLPASSLVPLSFHLHLFPSPPSSCTGTSLKRARHARKTCFIVFQRVSGTF